MYHGDVYVREKSLLKMSTLKICLFYSRDLCIDGLFIGLGIIAICIIEICLHKMIFVLE